MTEEEDEGEDEEGMSEEEDEEGLNLKPAFIGRVKKMFEAEEGLSPDDVKLLLRCTTISSADADYMDGQDVRGFEAHARIVSVDGKSCVHVLHQYHSRCRNASVEFRASVQYAVCAAAAEPHWHKAWSVSLDDTHTRSFCYAEKRRFKLTSSSISRIRSALFPPSSPLSELGAKLSDNLLMQWLLGAAGYQEPGLNRHEGPSQMRHTSDGWDGVNLRRVCRASSKADAAWQERDFTAGIEAQRMRDMEGEEFGY